MTEMPHHCSACGEVHGGSPRANPEVEVARIQAERDVRIAELGRGEFQQTELEAETEVAVAEIEAAAAVDEAIVKAEVLEEIATPPEPEPVPVVVEEAPAEEPVAEMAPPLAEELPAPAGKAKSNPWW